jgi:hypothetical protein
VNAPILDALAELRFDAAQKSTAAFSAVLAGTKL